MENNENEEKINITKVDEKKIKQTTTNKTKANKYL